MGGKRRQDKGWSYGLKGIDSTKGVVSGRWVAAREGVGSGRGGRGRKNHDGRCSSSFGCFCRGSTVGIIWREKKDISRGEWEISRGRREKTQVENAGQLMGALEDTGFGGLKGGAK